MRKTFTDERIVGVLRGFEQSGLTVKEYRRTKMLANQVFLDLQVHCYLLLTTGILHSY